MVEKTLSFTMEGCVVTFFKYKIHFGERRFFPQAAIKGRMSFAMHVWAPSVISLLLFPSIVRSHARLIQPPSRASMWRYGFQTRINYDDDGLYCGGLWVR